MIIIKIKDNFLNDLINSISEGYCIIDEQLSLIKMNNIMLKFFDTEQQLECLNMILYSSFQFGNGEKEEQYQGLANQEKNKCLSLEQPQSSIFNLNQYNNYDSWRKDDKQATRGKGNHIEIVEMETTPMANLYQKNPRLISGQYFKVQDLSNTEGNVNYQDVAVIDLSFQSKNLNEDYVGFNLKNMKKEVKQTNSNILHQNKQGSETIILKEINAIIGEIRNTKKQSSLQNLNQQKEIMKNMQKSFYIKYISQQYPEQEIYLQMKVTPFMNDSKIYFLIDAMNKTLYQSYCNLESQYIKQSSIICGFADESLYPIHYLIQNLKESKSYTTQDFSKIHIDPLLTKVFFLQNTMQILYEISHKEQPFYLNLSSHLLLDFLQEEIVGCFNWGASSRKVQVKIESDNDVPSRICTDFDKLKYILTVVIQNFMNFVKEGQQIIVNLKNQQQYIEDNDLSYINETQNMINNKQCGSLIQFSVSLSCSQYDQAIEESQRIQQVFAQSLKNSLDYLEPQKQGLFATSFSANFFHTNSVSQQINFSRKSSFYKSKTNSNSSQQKYEKIQEQTNSIQTSNMMAQRLISSQSLKINQKNASKSVQGLQFEKTYRGLPSVTFLVENQSQNLAAERDSLKFQNVDNISNLLNRQTTDGQSPIQVSQKQTIFRNNKIDNDAQGEIKDLAAELNARNTQSIDYHSFPKTKSLSHLNQIDLRKMSMLSHLCSTNELLRIEDVTSDNIQSNKRLNTNPKSLLHLPFDFQAAATTAQSLNNNEEFDDNHFNQNKSSNKTPKLEKILEVQLMEQSRDQNDPQKEGIFQKNEFQMNTLQKNQNLDQIMQMDQKQILNCPKQNAQTNEDRTIKASTKIKERINKQITFNKRANDSSLLQTQKLNGFTYNSYNDLPSSLSLSPKNSNNNTNNNNNQASSPLDKYEDLFGPQDQNIHVFINPSKSITYTNNNQVQNQENTAEKGENNQFLISKIQMNSISVNNIANCNSAFGLSFGQDLFNGNNAFFVGSTTKGEQVNSIYQTTPIFVAAQQSKIPAQLEITPSTKIFNQASNPQNIIVLLEKKSILFVDRHQLYHSQFQTILQNYAKENEDDTFQSAYTAEECIRLIEIQYQQNRFQYPYIFVDHALLNEGNNILIESIKNIFLIHKVSIQSQIFVCSNQPIVLSQIQNFGITSVIKKPIVFKELEDNNIVLFKKSQANTTLSLSFSPQYMNK